MDTHTELVASVQETLKFNSLRSLAEACGLAPSIISRFANEKSRCTMRTAEKLRQGVLALKPRKARPAKVASKVARPAIKGATK